jgi:hypothetical protein
MSTQTKGNFRKIINLWLMAFKMPGFGCGQTPFYLNNHCGTNVPVQTNRMDSLTAQCCDV